MSTADEKKFVIKHVFTRVKKAKSACFIYGNRERRHNIPWRIAILKTPTEFNVYLECLKSPGADDWTIDTNIEMKIMKRVGEDNFVKDYQFNQRSGYILELKNHASLGKYVVDNKVTVECAVTINKMAGMVETMRNFDESINKSLEVVLIVKNQKFFVSKLFLSSHSSYFEALLLGNFDESKQTEIELKDIDPEDFQNFSEVLHRETAVNDENVEGILQLADMYDAKTAVRRCEEFLVRLSNRNTMPKFILAIDYRMEKLEKKCIAEINDDNVEGLLQHSDMYEAKTVTRHCEKFLIELSKKSLKEKFDAAVKYKLKNLKEHCLSKLRSIDVINDGTVEETLELADMCEAKTALHQCEKFLINRSKHNLRTKFIWAVQYNLEKLKDICMSKIKRIEDIASVIPKNASNLPPEIWKELLNLSIDLYKKKK